MNVQEAQRKIDTLLQSLLPHTGLSLEYEIASVGPAVHVTFHGADVPALLARNAELLLAFEHIAVKALGLTPEQHDQVSFDAAGFKAARDRQLERAAHQAVEHVRTTATAYRFPPMNSRERRLLHLALASSGLVSASEGDGPQRHIVLHPPGK